MFQLEKVFEASFTVRDPINFCASTNLKASIMKMVHETYSGRNYKGAFIVSIKEIISHGDVVVINSNSEGHCNIDVRFLADVIVVSSWDIITNVKVIETKPAIIGLYDSDKLKISTTLLKPASIQSRDYDTISPGQIISIRVVKAEHTPMKDMITCISVLLTCDKTAPVYKIKGSIDQSMKVEFSSLVAAIDDALTARPNVDTFRDLLTAISTSDAPDGAMSVDLLKIMKDTATSTMMSGYWSRSLNIARSSPFIHVAHDKPPSEWNNSVIVDENIKSVVAMYLKNMLDFIRAENEMAIIYEDSAAFTKHNNIWAIMKKAKI